MELSAGASADSNSHTSTPLDSTRSCHPLLINCHRCCLPLAARPSPSAWRTRSARCTHCVCRRRCRRAATSYRCFRNCESSLSHADGAYTLLTVLCALSQVITKSRVRACAQAAYPLAQLGAGCSSMPVSLDVQRSHRAQSRRDCSAPAVSVRSIEALGQWFVVECARMLYCSGRIV